MITAAFEYARPGSVDEAQSLLNKYGADAKVIAGDQSLIPLMRLRLSQPTALVDIQRIPGLNQVSRDNGTVEIGALVRHVDIQRNATLREALPILVEMSNDVGDNQVRNLGTIGGVFAHGDSAGDYNTLALMLDAEIVTNKRRHQARDFYRDIFTTALEPGEVVTAVEVPVIASGRGWAFLELIRRVGDFALVEAAALIDLDDAGQCARVRLTVGAVGERPVDLSDEAGAVLQNGSIDEASAAEVGRRASAAVDPPDTVHGSGAYRREMVAVYVRRALLAAGARAGRGGAA